MDDTPDTGAQPVGPAAAPSAVTVLPYKNEDPLFWISAYFAGSIWLLLLVITIGLIVPVMLILGLLGLFTRSLLISWVRGNAVRVSAEQFSDLHQHFTYSCQRLGVKRTPELYLCQADGMLNALAVRFMRQDYVVLLSSIVDALKDRPEAIRFYMGHELAHIQRKHLTRHWWLAPAGLTPLLAPAYSRACEYTCDRHGLACCATLEDAQRALVVLAAGNERWKEVNLAAFEAQSRETGRFWMAVNELTADYPWLSKRMVRLANRDATFPRRSAWAWVIAALSPRMGYGGAVVGFLYLLIVGLAILALVLALALSGTPLGAKIGEVWQRVSSSASHGDAEPGPGALGGEAGSAEPAAPAGGQAEGLSADELRLVGRTLSRAVDVQVAKDQGKFPAALSDVEDIESRLSDAVGDRWQSVSLGYLTPAESTAKAAEISLEHACTDCSGETLSLRLRRKKAGDWECTVTAAVRDVKVEGCTAGR